MMFCSKHDHCFTQYWKLDRRFQTWDNDALRCYLRSAGYFFGTIADQARLQYFCTRAARGLISYDHFDVQQLRHLCTKRKVSIPPTTKLRKLRLRALLEAADEEAGTFSRFMELPIEIRLVIYQHYVAWLATRLDSCESQPYRAAEWSFVAPPPLASTSRQLRDEFLPEFYRIMNFKMISMPAKLPNKVSEEWGLVRFWPMRNIEHYHVLARYKISDVLNMNAKDDEQHWRDSPQMVTHGKPGRYAGTHDHYWTRVRCPEITQLFKMLARDPKVREVRNRPARIMREVFAEVEALRPGLLGAAKRDRSGGFLGVWEEKNAEWGWAESVASDTFW